MSSDELDFAVIIVVHILLKEIAIAAKIVSKSGLLILVCLGPIGVLVLVVSVFFLSPILKWESLFYHAEQFCVFEANFNFAADVSQVRNALLHSMFVPGTRSGGLVQLVLVFLSEEAYALWDVFKWHVRDCEIPLAREADVAHSFDVKCFIQYGILMHCFICLNCFFLSLVSCFHLT